MRKSLLDYEWQFLLQLVNRIHCCVSYEDICETLFKQLAAVIPHQVSLAFETERHGGRGLIKNPRCSENYGDISQFSLLNGTYPTWSEFIMSPKSTVFRQSDFISPEHWEKTRVYQDIWAPYHAYWGLMASIISQDCPLALIGFFRDKDQGDFSERDVYILETIVPALELKLYSLLCGQPDAKRAAFDAHLTQAARESGLTRRETEISQLICSRQNDTAICKELSIAPATLNKHISNIYRKTGVTSRLELISFFSD